MNLPGITGSRAEVETFGSEEAGQRACSLFQPGGTTVDRSDDAKL